MYNRNLLSLPFGGCRQFLRGMMTPVFAAFIICTILSIGSAAQTASPTVSPTASPTPLVPAEAQPTAQPTPVETVQPTPTAEPTPAASPVAPVRTETFPSLNTQVTNVTVPSVQPRVGVDPSQTISLTLDEAIRRALENNNDIEIARDDVRVNETTVRSLLGVYDPVFTITPNLNRNSQTGSSASFNLGLDAGFTQQFQRGGGTLTPFFNNSRFGSGSQFRDPTIARGSSFIYSSNIGVGFTQPLLRNRSIDNARRGIRVQRRRLEQSDADFRLRTIETIAQVQNAYYDLVFALRDQQNRVANLNLTRENLRRVEAQINAGTVAPLARAEVNVEFANRESDLFLATQQVTRAENILKGLLLRDVNASEWTAQIVPTDQPAFDTTPVNLNDSLSEARENRPELRRLRLERDVNDIDIEFFRNQNKPQLDFVSQFSLNGIAQTIGGGNTLTGGVGTGNLQIPIIAGDPNTNSSAFLLNQVNVLRENANLGRLTTNDIPTVPAQTAPGFFGGGFNRSFLNLFRADAFNFTVGVTLSFPLRNRQAKADLAGARIQRERIDAQARRQEQTVVAEVRNAVQSVETARLRVLSAQVARQNAEIQLQGQQRLYEVGRSDTFLLFQRENALANARNQEIRAETDYNKALAELQRSTSTTLRANNIVVESLVTP